MSGGTGATDILLVLAPLPVTLAVSWIDARRQIIPDIATIALALIGCLCFATGHIGRSEDGLPAALAWRAGEAMLAGFALFALRILYGRLRNRAGLGLGDVKFVAACTLWTGLSGLPVLILAASLSALAFALATGASPDRRIPFGPFLALGLHVTLGLQLARLA